MKKILLLFASLLLTSCVDGVSFKNNLNFDEAMTDPEEIENFNKRFNEKCNEINEIKIESKAFEKVGFLEARASSTIKYTIYRDGFSSETKINSKMKEYGVSTKSKVKIESDSYLLSSNNQNKLITFTKSSLLPTQQFSETDVYSTEQSTISSALLLSYIVGQNNIQETIYYNFTY